MKVDIDNVVYEMVESLDLDELHFVAGKLDVEHDESSWLKDEYIDKEQELKQNLEDVLRDILEPKGNSCAHKLAEMVLLHNEFQEKKIISKEKYVPWKNIVTWAERVKKQESKGLP